ncbi:hypothetical protein PTTG_06167 [Puccinia triticina 1-1 BBBD Race 1]|uniref:Cryptic loci regulator 2 N-terminal domain-containing protein n=2 Tax=Puccinia triticina TaxID=208348 RepID=A0A180GBZ2_PUCT1|nr:uncharacterized protein PtA15_2A689 [Puccinia triticina]OAV89872.1 hypothetical protein PTTG_06167 [Puccinia triticina 1-1 BBBD Race 1]WAQ82372.1 hypothetical protein PtA15_2A689 [Puccinia triticina]WAR53227.1 hypothetical protein PtB15_2B658 [Puccinia triticina]
MSSQTNQGASQAHYTIIRGTHRRDPNFINCLNSDGDPSKWRETGPTIDSTGATCYWKADDSECQALTERWKKTCGKTAAKLLGLTEDATDEDWRIHDFPKGYKLYRHLKGQREDVYLFGSEHVTKFRTANEFSPHFHWLCTYTPTAANRIYCKCKYCTGAKTQGSINTSLGLTDNPKRFSSPLFDSRSASLNKRKAEEEMAKENYRKRTNTDSAPGTRAPRNTGRPQSRRSMPANALNSVPGGGGTGRRQQPFSGPYVNKDRDRDLSEIKCTFRMAELVWCKLDRPIDGAKEGKPDLKIDYWPAICEERVLITHSEVSREPKPPATEWIPPANGSTSPPPPSPPSLKVQQKYQWKVRLLATCDVYCKDESQLLPYLNYPPPLSIYKLPIQPQTLKHIHDGHETDRPSIASLTTLSEAVTPFALSLQITAHIKKSYTLMDRYDIAYLKRLEARGQNIPIEDIQVLYEDSTLPWYQFIWWGAEKIWSGELVRMIVSAPDLPTGLRSIAQDASSRCFFLKITGIYRSNDEKGMVKGPIFELAPVAARAQDAAINDPDFFESDKLPGIQQVNRYMPKPPSGYYFRRLTPVGKEHHLVLGHIAGRYYPSQPMSALNPTNGVNDDPPIPMSIEGRSLILSGMAEGRWLHMHCETWAVDRKECFKEAEASAEKELIEFCAKPQPDEQTKVTTIVTVEPSNKAQVVERAPNGTDQPTASTGIEPIVTTVIEPTAGTAVDPILRTGVEPSLVDKSAVSTVSNPVLSTTTVEPTISAVVEFASSAVVQSTVSNAVDPVLSNMVDPAISALTSSVVAPIINNGSHAQS